MSGGQSKLFFMSQCQQITCQNTKNRIQKKMRAHTEYCPHLIWLFLLKNKFLLPWIINEYRHQ